MEFLGIKVNTDNLFKKIGIKTKGHKLNQLQEMVESQELQIQELGDILSSKGLDARLKTYRGNTYTSYGEAITEINKKYNGTADWGIWSANIIDVRSAFIIGKGLKVIKTDESGDAEVEWANKFMEFNHLKISLPIIYSNEAEIEGKFLAQLYWDDVEGEQKLKARYMSYRNYGYEITASPKDYLEFIRATYRDSTTSVDKILEQENFTYRKFGGNIEDPNSAKPKLWGSLTQIDDVDMAFRDWRKNNHIHANPFPYFKCETEEQAKAIRKGLKAINWRVGKAMAGTADCQYITVDTNHSNNLEIEIVAKLKTISGNTGVPVHFMGLPDLMSNRATADNLMELIWASTRREREIWESAYTELLRKAMVKYHKDLNKTPLDPLKIEVQIPEINANEWEHIQTVWLPLYRDGAISLHTLLSRLPGIDAGAEEEKVKEEKQENIDNFMIANKAMDISKQADEQNSNKNNFQEKK